MMSTPRQEPRARRSYDHRLREHVVRSGARSLGHGLTIPRSTVSTWQRRGLRPVVTVEVLEQSRQQLFDAIARPGSSTTKATMPLERSLNAILLDSLVPCASGMRSSLVLWALALVTSVWGGNAVAAVSVFPEEGCPASDAIDANLERLGALALLTRLGTAEVMVQEPSLHVSFLDRRGRSLGVRVVKVTSDCGTRATLAAAVIAAFVGDWAQTKLADAVSTPAAPPTVNPASAAAAQTAANRNQQGEPAAKKTAPMALDRPTWQAELGVVAFGVHDGDAGGLGFGVRANLTRGAYLASAVVEGALDREQPLGDGQGAYRFLRAGLGLGVRSQWPSIFWDTTVVPMVERLSLQGRNVIAPKDATDWGFVLAGHASLGWNGPRFRPFLFVGASYSIPGQQMTLTDGNVKPVPLSSVNVEAGLGVSLRIWQPN